MRSAFTWRASECPGPGLYRRKARNYGSSNIFNQKRCSVKVPACVTGDPGADVPYAKFGEPIPAAA